MHGIGNEFWPTTARPLLTQFIFLVSKLNYQNSIIHFIHRALDLESGDCILYEHNKPVCTAQYLRQTLKMQMEILCHGVNLLNTTVVFKKAFISGQLINNHKARQTTNH